MNKNSIITTFAAYLQNPYNFPKKLLKILRQQNYNIPESNIQEHLPSLFWNIINNFQQLAMISNGSSTILDLPC